MEQFSVKKMRLCTAIFVASIRPTKTAAFRMLIEVMFFAFAGKLWSPPPSFSEDTWMDVSPILEEIHALATVISFKIHEHIAPNTVAKF